MRKKLVIRKYRYICGKCASVYEIESKLTRSQQLQQFPIIRCSLKMASGGAGSHLSSGSGCGYLNAVFDPKNPKEGI